LQRSAEEHSLRAEIADRRSPGGRNWLTLGPIRGAFVDDKRTIEIGNAVVQSQWNPDTR
jgi:hypothetical protein